MEEPKPPDHQEHAPGEPQVPAGDPETGAASTPYAPVPPPPAPQASNTGNGIGIAGFVLALVGMVLFWVPVLGVILCALGIIFSSLGLRNSNKQAAPHKGLSIAGLTVGIVMFLVSLIFTVFVFIVADSCGDAWQDYLNAPVGSEAESVAYERWLDC